MKKLKIIGYDFVINLRLWEGFIFLKFWFSWGLEMFFLLNLYIDYFLFNLSEDNIL